MPEIFPARLVAMVESAECAVDAVNVTAKRSPKILPAFMNNSSPDRRVGQGAGRRKERPGQLDRINTENTRPVADRNRF